MVSWDSKVGNFANSLSLFFFFFLLIIIRSCLLAEIRWFVCMSKSQRSLCVSFSRTATGLCIYHLFVRSNFNFLHIFQLITLPTQSCLILYSFCANLLHLLIMRLMVSSLSPHSLHCYFVASYLFSHYYYYYYTSCISPQVSKTLLSILIDLNNAVVWLVSVRPPISSTSSSLTKPLGTILKAPIIFGITVTFMLHNFFLLQNTYLSFRSLWFSLPNLI